MIFSAYISNINIIIAVFEKDEMIFSAKISSKSDFTEDQIAMEILEFFRFYKIDAEKINNGIIASVVPALTVKIEKAFQKICSGKIFTVGPGTKTGLNIKLDSPSELGADFVCSAVYAKEKYSLPLIIIDVSHTMKISALDKKGSFLGGSIMAGPEMCADALSSGTAQLPHISVYKPGLLIGKNTVESMKSGIIYGSAAMLDGMIEKYKEEMKEEDLTVIVSGENSREILPYFKHNVIFEENIISKGMNMILNKNI